MFSMNSRILVFWHCVLPKLRDLASVSGRLQPLRVSLIPAVVFFLIHGGLRIFRNDFLNKPQYNLAFIFQGFLFCIQSAVSVSAAITSSYASIISSRLPSTILKAVRNAALISPLCKMGRGAMLASVFFVTLPYKAPVFRVGVPDLAAINAATLAADKRPEMDAGSS